MAAEQNGNGNVEEEMDDVEKEIILGRSGGVTGLIFPPPDIRAVVDKTAQWCVRCWIRRGRMGALGGAERRGNVVCTYMYIHMCVVVCLYMRVCIHLLARLRVCGGVGSSAGC